MRPSILLLPALLACTDAPSSEASFFTVAVIPDSQVYAEEHPEVFDRHTQWLVDNADELNLAFVTHVGDVVDVADDPDQWDVAFDAYARLRDAGIPHGLAAGNHDVNKDCPQDDLVCAHASFVEHFGPQFYEDEPWYGGASPSGASNYQRIDVDGFEMLFLHLALDFPESEVAWAEDVLQSHPNALAQIATHKFLFDYRLTEALPEPLSRFPAGRFGLLNSLLGDNPRYTTSLTTDEMFDRLVKPNTNVWSVHCGHVDAEFTQEGMNDKGLTVHEVLVDFQSMPSGGDGLLRLLRFTPEDDTIEVLTVSTETGAYRDNGEGFDHAIDLLGRFADRGLAELEGLGFESDGLLAHLALLEDDTPEREAYRSSLYDGGQRDSSFVLDVPFDAYMK